MATAVFIFVVFGVESLGVRLSTPDGMVLNVNVARLLVEFVVLVGLLFKIRSVFRSPWSLRFVLNMKVSDDGVAGKTGVASNGAAKVIFVFPLYVASMRSGLRLWR